MSASRYTSADLSRALRDAGVKYPRDPYYISGSAALSSFVGRWCRHCEAEREYRATGEQIGACPIITAAYFGRRHVPAEPHPPEIIVGDDGRGTCTAFVPEVA